MTHMFLLLKTTITTLLCLCHFINSYSPNPRAIHPDGKLPSINQAKRRLPKVQDEVHVFLSKKDNRSHNTLILIDGNNIRNSFGYHHMSALELTNKLSTWFTLDDMNDDDIQLPQIVCVWDGGKTRTSQKAYFSSSTTTPLLIGYSGPNGNADDLIVQCCSFVSSFPSDKNKKKVVIFTSDANLANRCQLQFMQEEEKVSSHIPIEVKIYHSIYLCLLLSNSDSNETMCLGSDIFAPDWERDERRRSVSELESFMFEQNIQQSNETEDTIIQQLNNWINGGLKGISVGRVTRGGSVLYKYNALQVHDL